MYIYADAVLKVCYIYEIGIISKSHLVGLCPYRRGAPRLGVMQNANNHHKRVVPKRGVPRFHLRRGVYRSLLKRGVYRSLLRRGVYRSLLRRGVYRSLLRRGVPCFHLRRGAPRLYGKNELNLVFVNFPFGGILFYVYDNLVTFVLITDNAVVKTGLPTEGNFFCIGIFGYGRFYAANGSG